MTMPERSRADSMQGEQIGDALLIHWLEISDANGALRL